MYLKYLSISIFIIFSLTSCDSLNTEKHITKTVTGRVKTLHGDFILQFNMALAPNTARRVIKLAETGFYDGLIFHRVIPGFIVQTGDPTNTGTGGSGQLLVNEPNSLKHIKGSVSMVRQDDNINSADSQFFISLDTHEKLDGKYTVFAKVISGIEVVKQIKKGDKILTFTITH